MRCPLSGESMFVLFKCTVRNYIKRSKTYVYVLTLRNFRNYVKISNDFNVYMLICYTFQYKCVLSKISRHS
jgi:hypothetical protein